MPQIRLTAQDIIARRKELWQQHADIEQDRAFVEDVAEYVCSERGEFVRKQIQRNPELLIEMTFVIVDKQQQVVPFFLNAVQEKFVAALNTAKREFEANRRLHLNFIVLKGRQQGFTSIITAYQLACAITQPNFSGYTLADDADNTAAIFEDKAKFPYDRLPDALKPTERYNNRRELHFEKLNSRWRIATAGNRSAGRSKTLNFFHGSEVAFWPDIAGTLAGLKPALTRGSIQVLESTANGYNEFRTLWEQENNWKCLFFEWWLTPEYRLPFEDAEAEQQFMRNVEQGSEWIWERCRWLKQTVGLDWAQVYWYYHTYRDLPDPDTIKQEYPCTADEAFLASGRPVFDLEKLIQRKKVLEQAQRHQPPTRGYFRVEYGNPYTRDAIVGYEFIPDPGGYIWLYHEPEPQKPYVLGGDTAGEGSDYFAAVVIDNTTGQRAAVLHSNTLDSDTYTHQIYALGRYYNDALIAVETNFNLHPIEELQRLHYPYQYMRRAYDEITGKYYNRFGFRTDRNTRPLIISREVTLIRDHIELFEHIPFLDECLSFVYNDKGRPEAEEGKHDDLIFADMIAEEARSQQRRDIPQMLEVDIGKLPVDMQEDYYNAPVEMREFLLRKWGLIK